MVQPLRVPPVLARPASQDVAPRGHGDAVTRTWTEPALFDADWHPDDGEQLDMFGDTATDDPPKLWPVVHCADCDTRTVCDALGCAIAQRGRSISDICDEADRRWAAEQAEIGGAHSTS